MSSNWPWKSTIQIRWRDLDALSHVNNAVFLTYLETTRLHYIFDRFGSDLTQSSEESIVLARATINYRFPILLTEKFVTVLMGVGQIRNSSWTFVYEIRDSSETKIFADAETVQVAYNLRQQRKIPIPESWKEHLEKDLIHKEKYSK